MNNTQKTIAYILGIGAGAIALMFIFKDKLFKPIEELSENKESMEVEKTWDPGTDKKIMTLHPKVRAIASKFINEVEKRLGHRLKITDGYRTFAEQDKIYAKGRTAPGKIVTKAKGGQSYHNYGLAFDCYFTENGKVTFKKGITPEVAKIGEELGLEWGGRWKSIVDLPHFQLTRGSVSELLALHKGGKVDGSGYVIV